jgi:hypothetical protein
LLTFYGHARSDAPERIPTEQPTSDGAREGHYFALKRTTI